MRSQGNLNKLIYGVVSALLCSCASLRNELAYQIEDLSPYQHSAELLGWNLNKQDYLATLERWPWARGAQWHRRTLILKTNFNQNDLAKLDATQNPVVELQLMSKIPQKQFVVKDTNSSE